MPPKDFKQKAMNILIFTNHHKLAQAGITPIELEALLIVQNNVPLLNKNTSALSFNNSVFSIFDTFRNVHLVYDGLQQLPENLMAVLNEESICIIHTNNMSENLNAQLRSKTNNIVTSIHNPGKHYYEIIKALLDPTIIDKVETAKKISGIDYLLEAKLHLLHKCISLEGASNTVKTNLDSELLGDASVVNAFDTFKTEPITPDNHFEKLCILRDALLPEY